MRNLRESQLKSPYNNEPVYYCRDCLSLAIEKWGEGSFCSNCGRTNNASTDIFTWREMWKNKYGEYPEE